jgi:hypothetical protein
MVGKRSSVTVGSNGLPPSENNSPSSIESRRVGSVRQSGWSIIRRRYLEGAAVSEDEVADFSPSGALAEDFETAVQVADAAADRRFEHADAAAQLAVIGRLIDEQDDLLKSLGLE